MLTKDLILCRNDRGRLRPLFIPVDNERFQDLAAEILAVFDAEKGPSREEIDEVAAELTAQWPNLRQARGVLKAASDLAEFSQPAELDYVGCRQEVLRTAAELLRRQSFAGEESYRSAVTARLAGNALLESGELYADLPANDRLRAFPPLTSRQLLERYNCGLVQGLLLQAASLTIDAGASSPARLRRLMRYLKFFRLLARGEQRDDGLRLTVDGPASILDQTRRYGLQLASFFPAVCGLEVWRLQAEVAWRGQTCRLELDSDCGLVGHYRHFGAYVPEEVTMFEQHFRRTAAGWKILAEPAFLGGGRGGELIFPDFSFADDSGRVVHLELFHRWHQSQLSARLEHLERNPALPLIIGIDRAACRDQELRERLEQSETLDGRSFLFRDYPTVDKTLKCLERFPKR